MRYRLILIPSLILFFFSCGKKKEGVAYESIVYRDNNIMVTPDTLPFEIEKLIENSEWTLDDENGNILAKGNFSNGFKTGDWVYHPSSAKTIEINWSKYISDDEFTSINYPSIWEVVKSDERPFQATFPLDLSETKTGKHFLILSHNIDTIQMSLKEYQDYYKTQMFNTENVLAYAFFEFETSSDKRFYFSRFIVKRDNEEILALCFLGQMDSLIYDITYSSRYSDYEEKHIIFFDMIRSLVLDKSRFFSPFDPIKKFNQMEYPEKSEPTS